MQPQVGVGVTAEDLMDGDGGVTGDTYQWFRTTSRSADGTAIAAPEGTNAAYVPIHESGGASDIGQYLRVVATYTDGNGGGKTAEVVSLYKTIQEIDGNAAPSFIEGRYDHQRRARDQGERRKHRPPRHGHGP